MVFWITLLTMTIWPYVSWRFVEHDEAANSGCNSETHLCFSDSFIGLPSTYWGLLTIAFGVLLIVLTIGYVYDMIFALWKEQRTVDTERNPFGTYALIPANVVMIGMMNRLLRDRADGDEKVIATCDWIDEWLEWCSSQEIWARSQHFWDSEFEGKVPDLFFLPDDAVEKARKVKLDD